ncbi:hypothetical protein KSP40_PGU018562 [Platanthera guangdongensis]|uniref:NADH dehydrogenase subunit 6 n=1 Tax=Platanthera guangdongensis TaxID=2320717 RepID=A0ABR2LUD7_9ASPA
MLNNIIILVFANKQDMVSYTGPFTLCVILMFIGACSTISCFGSSVLSFFLLDK